MCSEYVLLTFASSHAAMAAEFAVRKSTSPARLIPLPPDISAGCGLALRLPATDIQQVVALLEESAIDVEGPYPYKSAGRQELLPS